MDQIAANNPGEALLPLDGEALRLLIANRSAFKGFLRRRLPSDDAAEDVLQQSLLKAIRHSEGLSAAESATAWFYRVLRNSLIDFYRARAAEGRKHEALADQLAVSSGDDQARPDAGLMEGVCACLNRLLPSLKPEYAELVNRIDLAGEDPAEVAGSAGITYNNLMVRLHRARQALKKSLERSCGACTEHGCLDCTCGHGRSAAHHG